MTKKHVAVIMGGWSPERDISLISGEGCAKALEASNYQVSRIDAGHNLAEQLQAVKPDVIFNALHGVGGEDGVVQGLFELLEIPYTHSGVMASALAMDKIQAKKIFAEAGLSVASDMKVFAGDISNHPMTPPYVVKPINQGSSVGIELVKDETQDIPAILRNSEWPLMVEAFVPGRELSCAIWQGKPSEVMEIRASNEFYDFDAKYTEGGSTHIVPADISADIRAAVQAQTLTAHDALGCKGVTRTDFRLDETDGGYGLIILELNTQPGMTPLSLVPEMVACEGVSYEELVSWMVEDASCQR